MNTKEQKEYFLGLDMGTNSVGWAVTDLQYNLLRAKGKDMWGIREFDEALPAADRRSHRASRRNRQREQVRIGLLKSYFEDAVNQEDPNFYQRMENSFFKVGDKDAQIEGVNAIFNDRNYKDADYYRDYPTIFHLKMDLINEKVSVDERYARKVYLAVLNSFKRRGHFLNSSLSGEASENQDVWVLFQQLIRCLEELDICFSVDLSAEEEFKEILSRGDTSRSKKRELLCELLKVDKKNTENYLLISAICGLKIDLKKMFALETDQKVELDFSSAGYEDRAPEIYASIGDDYAQIVESMKQVYDAGVLSSIMSGVNWLSEARVRNYEKHKRDLSILKSCIKKYCPKEEYEYLFREDCDGSYSAYIGSVNSGKKSRRGENLHKSKSGDRYSNLKKRLKSYLDQYIEDPDVQYILEELDKETFLPKQLTFANGVIPNQLHERELRKILENASKHLPFLNEKDESGLTVSERIIRLFTFRIPYYVGPTSQNYVGNGWAIRKTGKEKEKIYPWNIEEIVDLSATKEEFITRMVRKCSYISGERALPKESLEYQAFAVLNAINNIRIDNERIPVSLKQSIYKDLFQKGRQVTKKGIARYLAEHGYLDQKEQLSGIDENIGCKLSTYSRFYDVFGEDINRDNVRKMIEDIVFWGTIYSDSRKMFREQIQQNYGDVLEKDQIKRIGGFQFRDWGNLSKEFLELKGCDKTTGEVITLIRALWEDNLNLMELLHSDKYTFGESLKEKQAEELKTLSEFTHEDLDEMYFSAPVKRMIWQTLQIIREIEHIMGCGPQKIYVEMTRTNKAQKGDVGRKNSREQDLLAVYKSIRDESRSWEDEIKNAGQNGKLKSKKMYLYYLQMGKDLYTGMPIDLEDLFDDNKYDIDHIYPRHFVKDDSIHNNLVLVDKRKNSRKSDVYPLDPEIRKNPQITGLWKLLHEKKLMSDEKYRRLNGSQPFSEEQKADFIARQMVETGQATKGVNDLLKELMPNTRLVYAKAENVSDFRRDYSFYKSRTINDFHHAQDAYLNIVVGNVYDEKFTSNPLRYIKSGNVHYNLGKMFKEDVKRGRYIAWTAPKPSSNGEICEEGSTMETVRKVMAKNSPLLTRLSMTQHGALSDSTIYPAKQCSGEGYLPVKSSEERLSKVTEYGGFNSIKNAYFFLVEHEVKGKGKEKDSYVRIRTIECVPIYKRTQIESTEDGLYNYCLELGLKNPSIRMKKIKPQSLIKVNGFPVYITGKTGDRYIVRNACNMVLSAEWIKYIHLIDKFNKSGSLSEEITLEQNMQLYDELLEKHMTGIYSKRPNPVFSIIKEGRKQYSSLEIKKQVDVLTQILNLSLICNSAAADLKAIGGSSKSGVTLISKQISKYDQVKLVAQSVTGLYEKEINLLTV
ncbi:MAG: type II CRISPR RNA-guided endonuclease Cas9 [Lachnospiraceae bacterium]